MANITMAIESLLVDMLDANSRFTEDTRDTTSMRDNEIPLCNEVLMLTYPLGCLTHQEQQRTT